MEFSDGERDLLLAALFELRIAHADDGAKTAQIEALVLKLGGDPDTAFFGAYRHEGGAVPRAGVPLRRDRRGLTPVHALACDQGMIRPVGHDDLSSAWSAAPAKG